MHYSPGACNCKSWFPALIHQFCYFGKFIWSPTWHTGDKWPPCITPCVAWNFVSCSHTSWNSRELQSSYTAVPNRQSAEREKQLGGDEQDRTAEYSASFPFHWRLKVTFVYNHRLKYQKKCEYHRYTWARSQTGFALQFAMYFEPTWIGNTFDIAKTAIYHNNFEVWIISQKLSIAQKWQTTF